MKDRERPGCMWCVRDMFATCDTRNVTQVQRCCPWHRWRAATRLGDAELSNISERSSCVYVVCPTCVLCVWVWVCVCRRDLAAEFDLELPFDTWPAGIANFCKEIARRSVSILKSSYGSCFQVTQRYLFDFDGWAAVPSMAWQRLLHWGLVLWSESCRSWNNLVSLPPVASISFLRLLDQIWPRHARHQVKNFFELIDPAWSQCPKDFSRTQKRAKGGCASCAAWELTGRHQLLARAVGRASWQPFRGRHFRRGHCVAETWRPTGERPVFSDALHVLFTCSSHALHVGFSRRFLMFLLDVSCFGVFWHHVCLKMCRF